MSEMRGNNELNIFSRIKFAGQYLKLVADPSNLKNVISINSTMAQMATDFQKKEIVDDMRSKPLGAKALIEKPRLGKIQLKELESLSANTLGRTYFEFLKKRNLNPNDLPTIDPQNKEGEFTYARAHLYETHDIWHVITGFDTDVSGELGLQAFYLSQFPAQFALVLFSSGFLSQVEKPISESRKTVEAIIKGYTLGQKAHDVVGRNWAAEWHRNLNELRDEMGIVT